MEEFYLSLCSASTDPTETDPTEIELASVTLLYARRDLQTDYKLTAMLSWNKSSLAQRCFPIVTV